MTDYYFLKRPDQTIRRYKTEQGAKDAAKKEFINPNKIIVAKNIKQAKKIIKDRDKKSRKRRQTLPFYYNIGNVVMEFPTLGQAKKSAEKNNIQLNKIIQAKNIEEATKILLATPQSPTIPTPKLHYFYEYDGQIFEFTHKNAAVISARNKGVPKELIHIASNKPKNLLEILKRNRERYLLKKATIKSASSQTQQRPSENRYFYKYNNTIIAFPNRDLAEKSAEKYGVSPQSIVVSGSVDPLVQQLFERRYGKLMPIKSYLTLDKPAAPKKSQRSTTINKPVAPKKSQRSTTINKPVASKKSQRSTTIDKPVASKKTIPQKIFRPLQPKTIDIPALKVCREENELKLTINLDENKTLDYIYLWFADMIHDGIVDCISNDTMLFLTDVILYSLVRNNPGIDLSSNRNSIWHLICCNVHDRFKKDFVHTCFDCKLSSDTTCFTALTPKAKKNFEQNQLKLVKNNYNAVKNPNKALYSIDTVSTKNLKSFVNKIKTPIVRNIAEIFDSSDQSKKVDRLRSYGRHKSKLFDLRTLKCRIYGILNNEEILIHDVDYHLNKKQDRIFLTLNGNIYLRRIDNSAKAGYYEDETIPFETRAREIVQKHLGDLGQILYSAAVNNIACEPQHYNITMDRLFIAISTHIFNTPVVTARREGVAIAS